MMTRIKTEDLERIAFLQGEAQELAGLLADLAHDAQEVYDTRSERWQESDRGHWYADWAGAIEEAHYAAQAAADCAGQLRAAPDVC